MSHPLAFRKPVLQQASTMEAFHWVKGGLLQSSQEGAREMENGGVHQGCTRGYVRYIF